MNALGIEVIRLALWHYAVPKEHAPRLATKDGTMRSKHVRMAEGWSRWRVHGG